MHGGDVYNNRVDIDFSVSLNPYTDSGLTMLTEEAIREGAKAAKAYPDLGQREVRHAVAALEDVEWECVIAGAGASELLLAISHMCEPKTALLIEPCYSGYEYSLKCVKECGIVRYDLKEEDEFALTDDVLGAITDEINMVYLADPNNPTGKNIDSHLLEKILDKTSKLGIGVVLDRSFYMLSDAYIKNTDEKIRDWISKYNNLFIVKSLTKCFALPGIRMGYVICSSDNASGLLQYLPEWNLPSISETLMRRLSAFAKDGKFYEKSIAFIRSERCFLSKKLSENGFRVYASDANYLLVKTQKNIYEKLLAKGILIRKCDDYHGLDSGFYRIAVREREDDIRLLRALGADVDIVKPNEIEKRSFEIISAELEQTGVTINDKIRVADMEDSERIMSVIKRCIHTTADFDYAHSMYFSENAIEVLENLIKSGVTIITDTNMALAGINKRELARYGCAAECFMSYDDIAKEAAKRQLTRAHVSMERAMRIEGDVIYVIGNAPTALITLREHYDMGDYRPAFIVGVPVGFVNVTDSKEMIVRTDIPCIINRGKKGGSNVAAAVINAILYNMRNSEKK